MNLRADNYKIVTDTNVLLHIYGYSPEFSEFAVECLNAVKDRLVLPSTVAVEYKRHQHREFSRMRSRISSVEERLCKQITNVDSAIMSVCDELDKLQYSEVAELKAGALLKSGELKKIFEDFFADRKSTLELLAGAWGPDDRVLRLFQDLKALGNIMPAITQEELYCQCDEAEKRYEKKISPGYRDANKKGSGLRKYGDYLLWWEMMRYAKKTSTDIIWVSDDVKPDWCEVVEGKKQLLPELISEFQKKTGQQIVFLDSKECFREISDQFGIHQSDAVGYALRLTDRDFCEAIADEVFERVADDLAYSGTDCIDLESSHVGDLGMDGVLDIEGIGFISGEQTARENDKIYYVLKYEVTLSGYSSEYWGRDDDTREVIASPSSYHEFSGEIEVAVTRTANLFMDFEGDTDFDDAEIVEGNLTETVFIPWSDGEE
ncbi:MAG: PIN-like domain-containing protein [bacterium]|nr:PIN-like domain-containing protein [bacterium]